MVNTEDFSVKSTMDSMKKRAALVGQANGGLFRVKARANVNASWVKNPVKKASWTSIIALDNWKHSIKMAQIHRYLGIRPPEIHRHLTGGNIKAKTPKLLKIRVSQEIFESLTHFGTALNFDFEIAKAKNVKIGMIAKVRRSIDRGYKEKGRYDPALQNSTAEEPTFSVCGQCKNPRRTKVVLRYEEAWTFAWLQIRSNFEETRWSIRLEDERRG